MTGTDAADTDTAVATTTTESEINGGRVEAWWEDEDCFTIRVREGKAGGQEVAICVSAAMARRIAECALGDNSKAVTAK